MFNSTVLDVAIGLAFVYFILSLVTSAGAEVVSQLLKWRAKNLEKAVANLFGEENLGEKFYEHPLIKGLYHGDRKPSYIPAGTFVTTLLDLERQFAEQSEELPTRIRGVLTTFKSAAADATRDLRGNLEGWFDQAMDRAAGWYRRQLQFALWGVALLTAALANADTLAIVNTLSKDRAVREAVVATATAAVNAGRDSALSQAPNSNAAASPRELVDEAVGRVEELQGLGIPLGWAGIATKRGTWWWVLKFVGLLLTAAALSLGAPFWFDALSKLTNLRAAGNRPQAGAGAPATPPSSDGAEGRQTRESTQPVG